MRVYSLDWDQTHLGDMNYDIDVIEKSISVTDLKRKLMKPEKVMLERKVEFVANISIIEKGLDFPVSNGFVVMSEAMIAVLNKVQNFSQVIYPVVLIDDTYLQERYDLEGNLKPEVKQLNNYYLLQTLEIFNGLDYSNSDYLPMSDGQLFPTVINKMILKEPETGFPSLFRITEKRSILFVSEQAKMALESNNIKGCIFKEVEATPFES